MDRHLFFVVAVSPRVAGGERTLLTAKGEARMKIQFLILAPYEVFVLPQKTDFAHDLMLYSMCAAFDECKNNIGAP